MVQTIQGTVRQFIVENFLFGQDDQKLANDSSLLEHGVIDSTGVLELIGFLEREYQIKVTDDEIVPENLDSVDRLVNYLEGKLACK